VGDYGAADEIAKLADLKDRGLLSDSEFEEQRRLILAGTKEGGKRRVPTLMVVGIVVVLVALAVGLLERTSSNSPKKASGNNTVHLSLASETSAENSAVGWAERQVGSSKYNGLCLSLVVEAYEQASFPIRNYVTVTIGGETVPIDVWDHFSGGTTGGPNTSPPAGALFFWSNSLGAGDSHVAISTGGWNFVTTSDVNNESDTHYETMAQFNANHDAHALGWWLPDGSSSPPPAAAAPAPTTSPTTAPLKVASGPTGSPAGGSSLQPAAGGNTLQPAAGGSTLQPAAGSSALGGGGSVTTPTSGSSSTPATAAPTIPTTQTTQPQSAPTPAPTTYSETAGGVSHTWTDYSDAGGNEGPSIASNQTVQIACKLTGFKVADGNTWWYRIAQSPWSNQYYVSADAFYNDGATSGSLSGTPFVDPAVPNC
jgi:hypothetical protein